MIIRPAGLGEELAQRVREEDQAVRGAERRREEERRIEELRISDPRAWAGMQADRLLRSVDVRPEEMSPLLVLLYDAHLGGEHEGFAEWNSNYRTVRKIGERLHELGGLALMLDTHRLFAEARLRGGARNLEMTWDGIGDWRG